MINLNGKKLSFKFACEAISGITATDCTTNAAGIDAIYITAFENVTGTTVDTDTKIITAIAMKPNEYFQPFQFTRNQAGLTETATINFDTNTTSYKSDLTIRIGKNDAAKRNKLMILGAGQRKLVAVARDNNGIYWFLGDELGAYLEALVADRGKNITSDFNGYDITISAIQGSLAKALDATSSNFSTLIQP